MSMLKSKVILLLGSTIIHAVNSLPEGGGGSSASSGGGVGSSSGGSGWGGESAFNNGGGNSEGGSSNDLISILVPVVIIILLGIYICGRSCRPVPVASSPPPSSLPTSFNESSGSSFNRAKQYQKSHPPPSEKTVSTDQITKIETNFPITTRAAEVRAKAWTFSSNKSSIAVSEDGFVVEFKKVSFFEDEYRTLLSQHPLYRLDYDSTVYYFEVTITDLSYTPKPTIVSIGVATSPYPSFRQVGWEMHSVGYHSDDGRLFHNDGFGGKPFQTPYTKGDTVGCGYNPSTGSVFFTLNGCFLGDSQGAVVDVHHPFHAAIGTHGPCKLSMNMGQRPFMFNLQLESIPAVAATMMSAVGEQSALLPQRQGVQVQSSSLRQNSHQDILPEYRTFERPAASHQEVLPEYRNMQ